MDPQSAITKQTFINAHVATILFHIILSMLIIIFSSYNYPTSYVTNMGWILFVVSIIALVPIYKSIQYPFTIN